ncbi:MAG: hypothetical protein HGB04_03175 [Chlorobiaceae bacterium]|nr:hypothetical protein [Chlorobiaceae bacterium]
MIAPNDASEMLVPGLARLERHTIISHNIFKLPGFYFATTSGSVRFLCKKPAYAISYIFVPFPAPGKSTTMKTLTSLPENHEQMRNTRLHIRCFMEMK